MIERETERENALSINNKTKIFSNYVFKHHCGMSQKQSVDFIQEITNQNKTSKEQIGKCLDDVRPTLSV